jgi:hypothetical protein
VIEYDYGFRAVGDAVTLANNSLAAESGGGGTIIGGGGDEDAFRVRTEVYRYLENFYLTRPFNPRIYPVVLVEILDEEGAEIRRDQISQQHSKVKWDRFLVPRNLLQKPARLDLRAPNFVVEEIGQYLERQDPYSSIGAKSRE